MSLEEVENFCRSLRVCPKCGSSEGFWLTAKKDTSYVQCKHCGTTIELCEALSKERATKKRAPKEHGILRIRLKF